MGSQRRSRISDEKWQAYKAQIQQLYLNEDRRLEGVGGVIDIMQQRHQFSASKSQFETRLKKWGFRKNVHGTLWRNIQERLEERQRAGKESEVYISGEVVKPVKIRREIQRNRARHPIQDWSTATTHSLPIHVRIQTPTNTNASLPVQYGRAISTSASNVRNSSRNTSDWTPVVASSISSRSLTCAPVSSVEVSIGLPSPLSPFQGSSEIDYTLPFTENMAAGLHSSALSVTDTAFINGDDLIGANAHRRILNWIKTSVRHVSALAFDEFEMKIIQFNQTSFTSASWYASEACRDLCRESLGVRMIHFVINGLVNNKIPFEKLRGTPLHTFDCAYKAGIQYLHSLSTPRLAAFLDSAPEYIRHSLERNLLCTAVELNAFRAAYLLLQRGLDPNTIWYTGENGRALPLQRACILRHVEVTRVLLEHGAVPSKSFGETPLTNLLNSGYTASRDDFSEDELDIIGLLLKSNSTIESIRIERIGCFQSSKLAHTILNNVVGANYHIFFEAGIFTRILETGDEDLALLTVKDGLSREWSEEIRYSQRFRQTLDSALATAVRHFRRETIERLLTAGARIGLNCFIEAVHSNKMEAIVWCLENDLDANAVGGRLQRNYKGFDRSWDHTTPLSEAILRNFQEAINLFEERGFVSRLQTSKEAFQAVMIAVSDVGNCGWLDDLLSLAAQSNNDLFDFPESPAYQKAFHNALHSGHSDVCLKLISAGVRPVDDVNDSLLLAVRSHDANITRLVLDATLDMPPRALYGLREPLVSELLEHGDLEMFKDIVNSEDLLDATVGFFTPGQPFYNDLRKGVGTTILGMAIMNNKQDAVDWLLASGANVNAGDDFQHLSPLAACIKAGNVELLQELLYRGADPFDNRAIWATVASQDLKSVRILLEAFATRYPAGRRGFGAKALFQALNIDNWGLLKSLVPHLDVNHLDTRLLITTVEPYKISALGMAIGDPATQIHNIEFVRLILQSGTNPNVIVSSEGKDRDSGYIRRTALLHAITFGEFLMVQELINLGANVNLPPTLGILRTPLQCASEHGREDIVRYLLRQGANSNQGPANYGGGTALQLASINNFTGIVEILIDSGADVNALPAMNEGRTAFEGATEHGRITMMLYLVSQGANLLADDGRQYKRALKFARKNGQISAVELAEKLYQQALDNAVLLAAASGVSAAEDLIFTDFLDVGSELG